MEKSSVSLVLGWDILYMAVRALTYVIISSISPLSVCPDDLSVGENGVLKSSLSLY